MPAADSRELLFTVRILVFSVVGAQWLARLRVWNIALSGLDEDAAEWSGVDTGSLYPAAGGVNQSW
ncbi:MAG: hypothetical protein WCB93_02925 [Gallionella sp.]